MNYHYDCDGCDRDFGDAASLNQHLTSGICARSRHISITQVGPRSVICRGCGLRFSGNHSLRAHLVTSNTCPERLHNSAIEHTSRQRPNYGSNLGYMYYRPTPPPSPMYGGFDDWRSETTSTTSTEPGYWMGGSIASSSSPTRSRGHQNYDEPNVFNCPLCCEQQSDLSYGLCGHIFCTNCFEAALSANGRCPMCRLAMRPSDLQPAYI